MNAHAVGGIAALITTSRLREEGVHDKNLKGYQWIAGDNATLNEIYAGMGTDLDFNYVKDQFLYFARKGTKSGPSRKLP